MDKTEKTGRQEKVVIFVLCWINGGTDRSEMCERRVDSYSTILCVFVFTDLFHISNLSDASYYIQT